MVISVRPVFVSGDHRLVFPLSSQIIPAYDDFGSNQTTVSAVVMGSL